MDTVGRLNDFPFLNRMLRRIRERSLALGTRFETDACDSQAPNGQRQDQFSYDQVVDYETLLAHGTPSEDTMPCEMWGIGSIDEVEAAGFALQSLHMLANDGFPDIHGRQNT